MELRHLRAFLAVAQHRHFTHAARAIGLAQPALSQHIAQLEDELGVRLFERTRRGALLTEPGNSLVPRAERVLAELAAARSDARDHGDLVRGRVVLGTIASLASLRLPAVIARFHRQHPGIEIALREGHSGPLAAMLATGAIDIAMLHSGSIGRALAGRPRSALPADLAATPLEREPLVLALPRGHALADRPRVRFAALAAEPFVIYQDGSMLRDVVLAAAAAAGFTPRIALEASGNDTVRAFVAAGLGITLLPRSLAALAGPPIAIARVASPRLTRTVSIARRRHGALQPAVQALFDFLRASFETG